MSTQAMSDKNLHARAEEVTRPGGVLGERVEELRERAQGLYQRSKQRAVELEGEFENKVREHPVRSVAIAAGVGLGLGVLIGVLAARR